MSRNTLFQHVVSALIDMKNEVTERPSLM